ncbi:MAG: type II CAAX endopeptidase family protein [Planctomycetota bacterium]
MPLNEETTADLFVTAFAAAAVVALYLLRVHRLDALHAAPNRRMNWGLLVAAATVGLYITAMLASAIAVGVAARFIAESFDIVDISADNPRSAAALLAVVLITQLAVGGTLSAMLLVLVARRAQGFTRIGLAGPRALHGLWIGLALLPLAFPLVSATSIVTSALLNLVGIPTPELGHILLEAMTVATPPVRLGFILSAVVIAPVTEELIFRGLLQTALLNAFTRKHTPTPAHRLAAIALTTALFTVIHLDAAALHTLPGLAILSVIIGYTYERTGSLTAAIVLHAAFNAANVALALAHYG